jgi:hypothetical protein
MKTFLNVIGLLMFIGAVALYCLSESSQLAAFVNLMAAVISFGFGACLDELDKIRTEAVEINKGLRIARTNAPEVAASKWVPPAVPGKEEYFISQGDALIGPRSRLAIGELLRKGAISADTYVICEGDIAWRTVADLKI